jgi:hypothetical protein
VTHMTDGDRHTTPRRVISAGDELWDPFGEVVGARNRSAILRQFMAWFLRLPGARLPERPPARRKTD